MTGRERRGRAMALELPPGAATAEYCYLTTTGRVSGRPHEIEIWFALVGATVYLLSEGGEQADWVKNLRRMPAVTVRLGDVTYPGVARALDPSEPADALARRLICGKYEGWREGDPLPAWARTALPVAVELRAPEGNRRPESSD